MLSVQHVHSNASSWPTEYEKSIAAAGIRLVDVLPCAFPDYTIIKSLQAEYQLLQKAMLTRFWRDNGPWALWRALDLANRRDVACRCGACFKTPAAPISCLAWDRFRWAMVNAGITHGVYPVQQESLDESAVQGSIKINFDLLSVKSLQQDHPKPAGFNALTACEYMAPVSHADLHLVIQTQGRTIGFTYGRKLWECTDVVRDQELRKLDMLFAALHRGESKLAVTGLREVVPTMA